MIVLLLVGFLGGLVTGISPCILPVLPVIFASGAASGLDDPPTPPTSGSTRARRGSRRRSEPARAAPKATFRGPPRPAAGTRIRRSPCRPTRRPTPGSDWPPPVAAADPSPWWPDWSLSFSVATLVGSWLLAPWGCRTACSAGSASWWSVSSGSGSWCPAWGTCWSARSPAGPPDARSPRGVGSSSVSVSGLVFVPCAGPVLAAIAAVGAQHHIGWRPCCSPWPSPSASPCRCWCSRWPASIWPPGCGPCAATPPPSARSSGPCWS